MALRFAPEFGGLKKEKRPTRYFFKLERERLERNILTSVLDSNDVEAVRRK